MSDTRMLQAILAKVSGVEKKVTTLDKKVDEVKVEVKNTRKSLTERIDKLGLQIAHLEDDAPTIEEFDKLAKRVTKLENPAPKN